MGIETVAAVSLGASAAGGILGAFGADKKADAEQASDNYKAAVARNNAIIAERNAVAAREAGGVKGQINDLKTKSLIANQLVVQAASGLDVNTGTAVDVRNSAHDIGRLDTLTIIANAGKEAVGYLAQAAGFTAESNLDTMAGENARTAGDINIASSLISGVSSVGDKFASYSQKGVFG